MRNSRSMIEDKAYQKPQRKSKQRQRYEIIMVTNHENFSIVKSYMIQKGYFN